jgi:hypothetical protein
MSLVLRQKKQNRNESIKAFKEELDNLLDTYKLDIETFPKLEHLQHLFQTMVKSMETAKKTRNNANTGLGKERMLTPEARFFIQEYRAEDRERASRSYMTSMISTYVKEKQLQAVDEKLYFRCDSALCAVFRSSYIDSRERLAKYLELRCRAYLKDSTLDQCQSFPVSNDEFQLKENDLISWRELQKILFLTFKDGPDQ